MPQFFSLLPFLFFTTNVGLSQTAVTIKAGSPLNELYSSGPIYRTSGSNMDFSQYAYLYTAGELGSIPPGTFISSIAWNKTNTGATTLSGGGKMRIYLKNSTSAGYNATFRLFSDLINGATLVYNNTNTTIPATAGFVHFPFIAPFLYEGGNLEVIVDWDISSVAGNPSTGSFFWERTTIAKKIYGYATAAPRPGDVLLPAGDSTGDITNTRPVVRFVLDATQGDCTVPPSAGSIAAPDSVCMGVNTVLSVTGASMGVQELGYQWQSSPDAVTWADFGTISDDSIMITPYADLFYRRIITCGSSSDTTAIKFVPAKPFPAGGCVCVPPPDNCLGTNFISRVQLGTIDKSSGCGTGLYSNYADSVAAPDFILTTSKFLTVDFVSVSSGNRYVQAWIDYNHDGIFNDGTTTLSTTGTSVTGTITVPATAQAGLTRMRVRFIPSSAITSNPGPCGDIIQNSETEDYLVNIIDFNACTTAPVTDITIAHVPVVCTSDSILLSTSGVNAGATFSYQWQTSLDGIAWQDIEGFKTATCVVYQDRARFYRTRISCADQIIYTTPVGVNMKPLIDCHCKLYRSFCGTSDMISRVVFGTLDNSSGCSTSGYADYSGSVQAPLIPTGAAVPVSVTVPDGLVCFVNVWIDYNMNGQYETNEHTYIGTGSNTTLTKNINVPAHATGGLTKMRVREKNAANLNSWDACNYIGSGGETEDYLINLAGPKHCIPEGSSVCGNGDVINRVIFGTIDTSTACSPNGFGDFTKGLQSNSIAANTYVPLSVQVGCNNGKPESVGVWIDFDQDGEYERSEFTLVGRGLCGTTMSADISIPTNAMTGLTNMRIRATSDDEINPHYNPRNACINYINGETEEYNIIVQPYSACPTNTWTGLAGNSNWDNAENWSCQQVPGVHSNVVINNGTVVVGSNVTIYSLHVNPTATVTIPEPFNFTVTH